MAAYAVHPSDHDLITLVLRPLVAGHQQLDQGGGFVHLADVYSVPPERLAERYAPLPGSDDGETWYFLCSSRRRDKAAGAPGDGCWTGNEVGPVRDADGRRVGYSRTLSYGAKTTAPWAAVTRRGWSMVELALGDRGCGRGYADLVLCKMFRSSRTDDASIVAGTLASLLKRKAVDHHPEAPPTVRQHC